MPMLAALVLVVGLATTTGLALAVSTAHDDNEQRLLTQRTREAGAVLEAAVPSIEGPLATAAGLADLVRDANPEVLENTLGSQVGSKSRFVSASVWPVAGVAPSVVIGEQPVLASEPPAEIRAFFARSTASNKMTVYDLIDRERPRLGYAYTVPDGDARFLVYAEQALPADRTAVPRSDTAFAGLDYAVFLGPDESLDALLTASTDDLPLGGRRAATTIALGDSDLRLVMAPKGDLGGTLLQRLPGLVVAVGLVTTLGAAALTDRLQRRRKVAEVLAAENARLYDEQRAGSLMLQHSLLPKVLPSLPGVEVAVRYQAGVAGTEVGGDWYDVVSVGGSLAVTVGDVSGRGLAAASVMASVRYTMRTLFAQGLSPGEVLAATNAVVDDEGPVTYFATAVCGIIDLDQLTVSFADAGHPHPLMITEGRAEWVEVPVGPPIGVRSHGPYGEATVPLPRSGTLLLVTDGLYERRGEGIDVGLERVRAAAESARGSLEELLDTLLAELTDGNAPDDTAILGLRWEHS
ncbi:MAG: Two component signal transduction histidine kinase [Acidimicrobiales bacterium]|nr:Two component signal transduction histidine kinase [Acidimicrobiales bacterium]